ncbi:MAG: Uma2 family endonuclease, partial [Lachnospiraceae bacterium]|nr:Uma2 family endonuclease [Lachnospiraceae bacterium]
LPMIAPVDVQLDQDDRTMVQLDVMIVCDRSIITLKGIFGAPDFIVEVLSPSTRKKDMSIKMMKYMEAGVREYWMIDVAQKKVIVYDLEHAAIPVIYSFSDPVPVGIWGGACKINLTEVSELLDELFPEFQLPGKQEL